MDHVFDDIAILEQARNGAGALAYRADIHVTFYLHAAKDELSSRRHKRPVYKDAIYFSTRATGSKDFVSGPANPENIANYPKEWAEFRERMENAKTSIRSLPRVTPAVLLTLEELGIFSIEDFAVSKPTPELQLAHAIATRWVESGAVEPAKKKGGWPKGKARKHVQDAEAAA